MKFYIVANKPNVVSAINDDNVDDLMVYTIVRKLKDCSEYVNKFLKMKNFTHFMNWCKAHNMNPEDRTSWGKYSSIVVRDQFRDFHITPIRFNRDLIGACLRLLNGCIPVGASYELPTEIGAFLKKNCDEETIRKIPKQQGRI